MVNYIVTKNYFHFQQHLRFKDDDGNDIDEEVETDVDQNVAKFTVNAGGIRQIIVHDYNRVGGA